MKNIINLSMLCIAVLVSMPSCKKYEEGPKLSLQSKTNRVSNTWMLENFFNNDVDRTSEYLISHVNYTTTFTKNGGYTYSFVDEAGETDSGSGSWIFGDKKEEIIVTEGVETHVFYILRLTEHNFWYYTLHGGDKHEYHLTSKF